MHIDTVAKLEHRLREYGLQLTSPWASPPLEDLEPGIPERRTITYGQEFDSKTALYSPIMTMTELVRYGPFGESADLLILGEQINERSADMFRRNGVNYLDTAGNAFISFQGVRIDVRGRRDDAKAVERDVVPSAAANLFSTKRSQVIFALLAWPDLLEQPLRRLAMTAGVSVGQAQKTLTDLAFYNFLDPDAGARHLRHRGELIDGWATAFPSGIGSPRRTRRFFGDIGSFETPPGVSVAFSGEAAVAGRIRPETMTLYVEETSLSLLAGRNRWRTDRSPNIFVRTRFWEDPLPQESGIAIAPLPLIYADLISSGDGRQAELARELRRENALLQ
ncbi:MAG: hypothetical protein J7484_03030 [Microbacterium sp.]|nr:hypothetical protein [Microbacterium sp.]